MPSFRPALVAVALCPTEARPASTANRDGIGSVCAAADCTICRADGPARNISRRQMRRRVTCAGSKEAGTEQRRRGTLVGLGVNTAAAGKLRHIDVCAAQCVRACGRAGVIKEGRGRGVCARVALPGPAICMNRRGRGDKTGQPWGRDVDHRGAAQQRRLA